MSGLNAYINFNGQAREAAEFYHSVFGGKLDMTTYKEGGMPENNPDESNKIMHSMIAADNGMVIMVADMPNGMEFKPGNNISLSLSGDNEAELRGYWDKLTQGGKIVEPLTKAPWGDIFGMFVDKFGINWMVNITAQQS